MNNVNPPSSFTACILLHTYTQERSQSSAESAFTGGQKRTGAGILRPRPGFENSCGRRSAYLAGLLQVVYDGGIGEGRDIPEVVLALGHAAQNAAHDLAAPRLRQVGGEDDLLWPRVRAYGLPDLVIE